MRSQLSMQPSIEWHSLGQPHLVPLASGMALCGWHKGPVQGKVKSVSFPTGTARYSCHSMWRVLKLVHVYTWSLLCTGVCRGSGGGGRGGMQRGVQWGMQGGGCSGACRGLCRWVSGGSVTAGCADGWTVGCGGGCASWGGQWGVLPGAARGLCLPS